MAIECVRYEPRMREDWDDFVAHRARATHFFFRRGYMDYHADRFSDHSLLFYVDGDLSAVLPANRDGQVIHSHQGLTYGGLVVAARTPTAVVLDMFDALRAALASMGFERLVYKVLPHIYSDTPTEDDLYALGLMGGSLARRELSSVLAISRQRDDYTKGKRANLSKARRNSLELTESRDFAGFMGLMSQVLQARHDTRPTHSADEILLLAERFPENIRLFVSARAGEILAGVLVYINANVVHTQYMANSELGREMGALDFIVDHLITERFRGHRYLSFGVSTEDRGRRLNPGLLASKEAFGAGPLVHDTYVVQIARAAGASA